MSSEPSPCPLFFRLIPSLAIALLAGAPLPARDVSRRFPVDVMSGKVSAPATRVDITGRGTVRKELPPSAPDSHPVPPPGPDIQEDPAFTRYAETRRAHSGWTFEDLRKRYPIHLQPGPAYPKEKVEYRYEISQALAGWQESGGGNLSDFLAQVRKEGMAVNGDIRFPNFIRSMEAIWKADLPLLFTSDALLHSVYLSYDNILMDLESTVFLRDLDLVAYGGLVRLAAVWEQGRNKGSHVQDVRDLLETAEILIDSSRLPVKGPSPAVAGFLEAIGRQELATVRIFGRDTAVDFSQFKPRGHYTKSDELTRYFQAMMWLSRADIAFHLDPQEPGKRRPEYTRMKKAAMVLWDCVREGGSYSRWKRIDRKVEYLVGTSDGMTMTEMDSLAVTLGITDVPAYVARFDAAAEERFDAALAASGYGRQAIQSQARHGEAGDTALSPIFSFMPQRFVLDSYTFSQLVHPYVPEKAMPTPLEIAFVLGDNSALDDLKGKASASDKAVPVLAAQRELYDGIAPASWDANLYTGWLDFLRKLNGAEANPKAAPAFRTASWRAKMRNTQLASWAQLRHNTLLYVKQSYTTSLGCDFPRAYVEPYPEFFAAVGAYARQGKRLFAGDNEQVAAYFTRLEEITGKLREAAERTAQGKDLTGRQVKWFRDALKVQSRHAICTVEHDYDGWYLDLYYGRRGGYPAKEKDFTIADVHTKPVDDELGPAWILHAATGPVEIAVAALPFNGCLSYFAGPVSSYYEVSTKGQPLTRLSDEEWKAMLDKDAGMHRPAWTRRFRSP